jgi:hypothetical protein
MADVSIGGRAARVGAAATISNSQRIILAWTLSSALMLLALSAPALWNGFPLIFPDTGGYLERPFEGTLDLGRSALYGLFLYAGIPFALWPVVIAQAALTVWLIVLSLRAHGLGARPWLALGIMAVLAAGSSLPWLTGQLLPDILFPAAVLSLHLLIFRTGQLARWERFGLAGVIAFAISSHMAAAGLCVGVVAALWLLGRMPQFALPQPRVTFAGLAVAAGIALCPISNWAITGTFAFTPGGSSFLFGRLVEDGIVARYLDDRCPDAALRLCAYKASMPDDADDWLWDPDSPFRKLGGWEGIQGEERAIILATLARYPLMQMNTAVTDTFQQFISFQTEVSLDDNAPTIEIFANRTPQLMPELMSARQQTGAIDVDALNLVHVPVAALAIAALAGALLFRRRLNVAPEFAAFCATVLLALVVNAVICGVFSHTVDRYQSRLMPLALFGVALLVTGRWRRNELHLGQPADLA